MGDIPIGKTNLFRERERENEREREREQRIFYCVFVLGFAILNAPSSPLLPLNISFKLHGSMRYLHTHVQRERERVRERG